MADGRLSYWCTPGSGLNCGMNPDYSYQSTILGNTDKGYSNSVTFSLNKPLSNGWYGNISYTYTDAEEVGSDASSRSEEHTSELQSLIRISYAVLCLKKKKTREKRR